MSPIDVAGSLDLVGLSKTVGIGLTVLFAWLWHEIAQRREVQGRLNDERKLSMEISQAAAKDLLAISKENIETLSSMAALIESLAPSIANTSQQIRTDIDKSVSHFKDHIDNNFQIIQNMIANMDSHSGHR